MRHKMLEISKDFFSRWPQEEVNVPNNKRMFSSLFVMKNVFLFLRPLGASKKASEMNDDSGDMRFWVHRCSHKLSAWQM